MRLSKALCAVVGEILVPTGSHATLEALFYSAGAPGPPPELPHHAKWKEWLFRAGQDHSVDSLSVLGNLLEEFMDLPPADEWQFVDWTAKKRRVETVLEENGLRYFRFGRVLPQGTLNAELRAPDAPAPKALAKPKQVEELLEVLVRGLRRAMHPLSHRRKGAQTLSFQTEYDVQDLLHALLRPWVADIRPEEFTPSYAGSSTRMDFLLPAHGLVLETKIVRDRSHAKRVGDELVIDIDHYQKHQDCLRLWCVVFDPNGFITNAPGITSDLEGVRKFGEKEVSVKVFML